MAGRIVWTVQAQYDRIQILSYWKERNKSTEYSRKLDRLFRESVRFIKKYPLIGKPTDLQNVRLKIVRNYLIVYEIKKETIIILRIWDSRRNPGKLKEIKY
ncbi:MAG: type II toxin-antitoxin system RelE/ParE family toxin [Prolixibacteraceae bacterium]